jgi:hypothetical protein
LAWRCNASDLYPHGDEVQTVEPWCPPGIWADVSSLKAREILLALDRGLGDGRRYSNDGPAGDDIAAWRVVQDRFPDKTKKQCQAMIATWLKNGALERREYQNPKTREKARGLYAIHAKLPGGEAPE